MHELAGYILILEAEPLIALDLEQTLEAAGLGPVVCLTSCADAEVWLAANTACVALLDIMLKDGSSAYIAEALSTRDIPIIVCSAAHPVDTGKVFVQAPWLAKPCDPHALISVVRKALDVSPLIVRQPESTALATWRPGGFL